MKRIVAVLMIFSLSLGSSAYAVSNPGKENILMTEYDIAKMLVFSLIDEEKLSSLNIDTVSRAEFVSATAELFMPTKGFSGELPYKDVVPTDRYYNAVGRAYELGWISESTKFMPDESITELQAAKIVLSAVYYGNLAEMYGGYPLGYQRLVNKLALDSCFEDNTEDSLSKSEMIILFSNILQLDSVRIDYISEGMAIYKGYDIEIIESTYGLTKMEGIVTQMDAQSLLLGEKVEQQMIGIDGKMYSYNGNATGLLGYRVKAYYNDDTNKIVAIMPLKNDVCSIDIKDFCELNDKIIYLNSKGKEIKRDVDQNVKIIYNGCRVETLKEEYFKNLFGEFILIDNNDDGKSDVIKLNSYTYACVKSVGLETGSITFDGITEPLNFEETELVTIKNENGDNIELYDLKNDTYVAIKKSPNSLLWDIILLGDVKKGVYKIDISSDNEAVIDDVKYSLSRYCINNCMKSMTLGQEIAYYKGLGDDIAAVIDYTDSMKYGYLLACRAKQLGLSTEVYLKILSISNQAEVYTVADKVRVDGELKKKTDFNWDSGFGKQVIKYAVNGNGEIKVIDRAEPVNATENEKPFETESAFDSLRQYTFEEKLMYKQSPGVFAPKIGLKNATLFAVPTESDAQDEDYRVIGLGSLQGDQNYTVDTFDVNEYGDASLIVIHGTYPFLGSSDSYMVENVGRTINSEGDECLLIRAWKGETRYKFCVDDNVEIEKISGNSICPGDIVRIWCYNQNTSNKVEKIIVDVDFSSGSPVINNTSVFNTTNTTGTNYVTGHVYSIGDNSLMIAKGTDLNPTTINTTWNNMRFCRVSDPVVHVYDGKNVLSRKLSDLHSYMAVEDSADFVYVRMVSESVNHLFAYDLN